MFTNIAGKIMLPLLRHLQLDGFQCLEQDLKKFLKRHRGLESLALNSIDIVGEESFSSVLHVLKLYHDQLKLLRCDRFTESANLIHFHSFAEPEIDDHYCDDCISGQDCFPDMFHVDGPDSRLAIAEEWEGVQCKIGFLLDDFNVTRLDELF